MNKQKKLYLPPWFPYPSSWLKALIMVYFITILVAIIKDLKLGIYCWQKLGGSLELFICLSIIFLFFLIPVFAFLHHYFILIFHIFRKILHRSYRYNFFLFPPITSWWKALYSWLIIIISTLAATLIYTLILPWFNLNYQVAILEKSQFLYPETSIEKLLLFIFISVWLIVAAKLYQFEFLSKSFLVLNKIYSPTLQKTSLSKQPQINLIEEGRRKKKEGRSGATPRRRQTERNTHQERKKWMGTQTPSNCKHRVDGGVFKQKEKDKTENELTKTSTYSGVKITNKPQSVLATKKVKPVDQREKSNYLQTIQKTIKNNILVLLIIPLLTLGIYGFYQWQLMSEKTVVIVPENPSPIAKKVNSENLEIEEVKTQPTPVYSPIKKSSPIPKTTIVLPPPDPFKLAVNRAINAAEMAQSAQTKIEWEAVASQWQDATEFMKIVPASHPKYKQARKKVKEYQGYADYAIRVAKIKK
ncbi:MULTISPECIES: hypothetical protein [Okeania]|uniref:Uncharacterized protein n=1 Tax=Okeania hirsuta TaxID=1458930 RepID=A0A3N6NEQ2_9CYAN|nr:MULTISPECIES: hypothetical protein [Okeania]NET12351.1 hypothetical protein [Okeania sp. SIO1H6]NES75438.1 hypothetical protein [Okeania sp. SIO1H4]NET17860.1 hypothetical protein [Okeania sp. SIO1H5]NET77318.1 hypothetical protein [Okeania sp. SIO1F9]NET92720.1 hypothetical protein [Okeania sp. SIO1H2]